jgi:hypothetical protein
MASQFKQCNVNGDIRMSKTTIFLTGLLAACAAQVASAQGMGGGMGGMGGMGGQNFAAIDADSNGELTLQELLAAPNINENQAQQRLDAWDADDNGTVSEMEFNNRPRGGMGMG